MTGPPFSNEETPLSIEDQPPEVSPIMQVDLFKSIMDESVITANNNLTILVKAEASSRTSINSDSQNNNSNEGVK